MLTLLRAGCTAGAAQLVDPRPFTYPPPDCPVGLPLAPDEAMGVMGDGPAAGPPAMTLHVGAGATAESRPHADVGITGSPVPQAHADRLSLLLHAAKRHSWLATTAASRWHQRLMPALGSAVACCLPAPAQRQPVCSMHPAAPPTTSCGTDGWCKCT